MLPVVANVWQPGSGRAPDDQAGVDAHHLPRPRRILDGPQHHLGQPPPEDLAGTPTVVSAGEMWLASGRSL